MADHGSLWAAIAREDDNPMTLTEMSGGSWGVTRQANAAGVQSEMDLPRPGGGAGPNFGIPVDLPGPALLGLLFSDSAWLGHSVTSPLIHQHPAGCACLRPPPPTSSAENVQEPAGEPTQPPGMSVLLRSRSALWSASNYGWRPSWRLLSQRHL